MSAESDRQTEEHQKKSLIKKFVIAISRPLSTDENLLLIEGILNDLKPFQLDVTDYGYLWKGIFYSIWYAEMGKGCERIVERLHELANAKLIIHGLEQMNGEWFSIDYIRIDKYMYLTRRLTHKLLILHFCQFVKWFKRQGANELTDELNEEKQSKQPKNRIEKQAVGRCPNLLKSALNKMSGVGLIDHFLDVLYAECFKIISPFLGSSKQSNSIAAFLRLINRTLFARLAKSSKDQRIQAILKVEFLSLFSHLKRNKFVLERTMTDLIALCNASTKREVKSIGSVLEKRFNDLLPVRSEQPEILPPKAKLTYNRKKAMKNKRKRMVNKRRKLKEESERKLVEERSQIKEISAEDQFNELVGID